MRLQRQADCANGNYLAKYQPTLADVWANISMALYDCTYRTEYEREEEVAGAVVIDRLEGQAISISKAEVPPAPYRLILISSQGHEKLFFCLTF